MPRLEWKFTQFNINNSQDLHDNTFDKKIFQSTIMSQKAKSLLSETVTFTMGHQ